MAFSGGTFSRTFDCTTDRDNGVKILASKFDTELDGFATGLSTCILKDGTQTCTAAIPFAEGLTVPDNKTIILGTNSDITIQYDETTNDSLEIAANVEGAALGIVLKADQGDDNADQHKVSIADGGTLTLGSKISGSFVNYLTHTPNSTVASSTTAVAGNLTVGGDLTLGSGAVISEAELEAIDGVTAGTVAASKAVIVDSNKDIASFRNVTLTGELDAGSLDISGDADIDGTLEADAMTLNGTAITATATLDTGISNNNVPKFTSGVADDDFLRVAGTAIEGRSASEVLSDIGGQASLTFGISNTNAVKIDSSSVADDEYARFTANGLESRATSEVLSDIGAAPAAGSSNIVTTGALNSGSITSGFGSIDNGSSAITTTGVGSFGSLDISGDIDVDGTTNLDAVDIDGAVDIAGNLSVDGGTIKLDGNYPTGTDNTALGDGALDDGSLSGGYNVAVGKAALGENEGGQENVAVGWNSLDANTSGNNNSSLGSQSLSANTSGASNTAVGKNALRSNQTGNDNVAVGQQTLEDNTGSNNTAVGYAALLENTSGTQNSAFGRLAGDAITTGSYNTFIGANAGGAATTGDFNAFLGRSSGSAMTTGAKNTIIGSYNGNQDGLDIRTGSTYIVLSDGEGNARMYYNGANGGWRIGDINTSSSSTRGHNIWRGTHEGYHIIQGKSTSSGSTFQVYKETTLNFAVNVNGNVTNTNNSYGAISDIKLKQDIVDASSQWEDIKSLQVRKFKFKNDVAENGDNAKTCLGLIAQEAELISPNLIETVNDQTLDSEGEPVNTGTTTKQVKYSILYMKAVKALQEAMTRIETLETKVAALEAE